MPIRRPTSAKFTPAAFTAVSCARKSLSPSEYFCSTATVPPPEVKVSRKYFARPTLYALDTLEMIATRFACRSSRANFAITVPWNGSMKHTRKM